MAIVGVIAGLYLVLLLVIQQRRTRRNPAELWLMILCLYMALVAASYALLANDAALAGRMLGQNGWITTVAHALAGGLAGFLTLAYNRRQATIPWSIFSGVWLGAVVVTLFTASPALTGDLIPWPASVPVTLNLEVFVLGWAISLLALVWVSMRAFFSEPLPLYANRNLFWALLLPLLFTGHLLSAWSTDNVRLIGYAVGLAAAMLAAYAVITPRVLNVRELGRFIISRSILALVTGLLVLIGILGAVYLQPAELQPAQRGIVAGAIALLVAVLIAPAQRFFRWVLRRMIRRSVADAAAVVRTYSQRVSRVIELEELAHIAIQSVTETMYAQHGYLIIATPVGEQVMLEVINQAPKSGHAGSINRTSPLFRHFTGTARPVLQYDIEYQREFIAMPDTERNFFNGLGMDIYAPIVNDGSLLGILAVGPKNNDDPFSPGEIELLAALANQTVAALENARLVNDLRTLNERITALNENLRTTNERLERLDHVKSDFIAIASHELRTPLTQIQGYADLLLEMAKRNMLDPSQTEDITRSLGKASQRMADVISSMLDVSQIDVENMDLNFVETNLANILKLAIDPYQTAIQERNLMLIARGLRDLPSIQADYKRLVQAFQNLVTNAVKFTPDGGQITVTGQVFERDKHGEPVSVRITIADTGIGIDPENHDLIFEKFYRVGSTMLHSTGETKFKGAGPGLGLAIARGIIEGHGGRIWVESAGYNEAKMPGSAFHVVLPIRPTAIEAQQRIRELQSSTNTTAARRGSKVLVQGAGTPDSGT